MSVGWLFSIQIFIQFQLVESSLYPCGLTLLEQSLVTLESQGVFDNEAADLVLLRFRNDSRIEWHCKQLDRTVGVSFINNFHFALVAYLLKGNSCPPLPYVFFSSHRVNN